MERQPGTGGVGSRGATGRKKVSVSREDDIDLHAFPASSHGGVADLC